MATTTSILLRESNQKGPSGSASQNVGSFVKINSISIDLEDKLNVKNYSGKCDHNFSIRGYVSEVRRRNWKLCWPFPLDDDKNKSEVQKSLLPPLTSQKFRWWSCQRCLSSEVEYRDHDHDRRSNIHSIQSKSKGDCSKKPSLCITPLPLTDVRVAPKTNIKSNPHTSTDVNIKKMHQDHKKVLVAAEASISYIGPENSSETLAGVQRLRITSVPVEINLNVMQEKPEHDAAECAEMEGSRTVDTCKHTCGKNDGSVAELATSLGMLKNSAKICLTENPKSVDEQLKESKLASGSSILACINAEAGYAVENQTAQFAGRVLDEHDRTSPESVEIVGNNLHSTSSGPQRRKTRKVRLLTDLLGSNGDGKTDHVSTEVSPSNAANSGSVGIGMRYVPQGQVSFSENCGQGSGDCRKRKSPQDEARRFPETSSLVHPNKRVKNCKSSEESVKAVADSALEGAALAGLCLESGIKSHLGKHGSDSVPITEKKKMKKNQSIDGRSYLVPVGDNFPNQVCGEVRFQSKDKAENFVPLQVVNDAASSRGMEKSSLAASRKEKKQTTWNNKSKMPQVDGGKSSQYPWSTGLLKDGPSTGLLKEGPSTGLLKEGPSTGLLKEGPSTGLLKEGPSTGLLKEGPSTGLLKEGPSTRSEEVMHPSAVNVSFRQADAAVVDTGLKLSIGGYLAPKKCNSRYNPQDGRSSVSWQEGTSVDESVRRNVETNYISNATVPSKSGSYAFFKKRVHGELSGKLIPYTVPIPNGKHKNNSHTKEGCRSLGKQVDISGASNYQKTTKTKGHSAVSRTHSEKRTNNISDQGGSDDIPMEIVELLAQYQYERRQENTENSNIMFKKGSEGRNIQMLDYDKVYGTEKIRISEDASKRSNSQARNGRNGNSTARKNVQPSKQKSFDYLPNGYEEQSNNSHLGHKKPSSSIQLPTPGSTKCSCAKNCKWNASMVGNGFLNTGGVQRGSCDACPVVLRPAEEAAQIWPTGVPLQRPVRYDGPQNSVSQRSNLHMVPSASGLLKKGDTINREHELNYLKIGATNLETPSQHIASETFSRRNADYQFANKHNGVEHQQNQRGSLDLYSNETIPAMHLLSLMDAGMPSGTTFNTGGNTKFLKRDHHLDNNPKEYTPIPISVYGKSREAVKHPLGYRGKHQLPLKPHDFFPVNPEAGPSTSSFRHEKGFERANDFTGQASFSSRGKEKVQKSSGAPAQNRGRKPLNPPFASDGFAPNHNNIAVHRIQKDFLGSSSSLGFPLQSRALEKSTELKLKTPNYTGAFRLFKSGPEFSTCSINRNPADFSSPEAGNEYMIKGENLKVRKPRKRTGLTTTEQRKRQKTTKRTTVNVQA